MKNADLDILSHRKYRKGARDRHGERHAGVEWVEMCLYGFSHLSLTQWPFDVAFLQCGPA